MLFVTKTHRARSRALYGLAVACALFTVLLTGTPALADEKITVVELFTSQGCPACPRADKLLGELAVRDDILALSQHVDYWDYYGWPDPFASDVYSHRQQRYLDQRGLPYVYTPQIVVDGKHHASGNKPHDVMSRIESAQKDNQGRIGLHLERLSDTQIRIQISDVDARYRGEAEIIIVRYDDKHVTEVTGGENRGKTITNFHVVRLMRPVALWNGEAVDVVVALQELEGARPAYCAIFVQERGQGRILGASAVDMRVVAPRG
jgi:hypothetical protein